MYQAHFQNTPSRSRPEVVPLLFGWVSRTIQLVVDRLRKNEQISSTRRSTIARHRLMLCRTYELKVDKSHCSAETLGALRLLFLEGKWFYNHVVSAMKTGQEISYKTIDVSVKTIDGRMETRHVEQLSSQMRQGIIEQVRQNLRSLSGLRRSGRKAGDLRFASRISTIPLVQYGRTHSIKQSRVRIQRIKQKLRVSGVQQIPEGAEMASARLIKRGVDYLVHVTCYIEGHAEMPDKPAIGVDAGIRNQLVFSNGASLTINVPLTRRLKLLQRELMRRRVRSRNRAKTAIRLGREWRTVTNRKLDTRRKIVSYLVSNYGCVATQKDTVAGWQRLWGRRIMSTAIGGIMSDLRTKPHTPIVVGTFVSTTTTCSRCGASNVTDLGERVYECSACGLAIDRDLNAARNILLQVPEELRESTPADTDASTKMVRYLDSIPFVKASMVEEAGSHSCEHQG